LSLHNYNGIEQVMVPKCFFYFFTQVVRPPRNVVATRVVAIN
jgi:hypothetical protein